jgi:DNA-binding transcriptional ArsR family regulator
MTSMSAPIAQLASPRRREILRLVWEEERGAGAIHRALGDVTFGAVSQHLGQLAAAGLVEVRSEGRRRFYRARRESLGVVADALEAMWNDALYRLKVRAELEEARRGPRPRRKVRPRRRGRKPS